MLDLNIFFDYNCMQTTNRSGLHCQEHPRQEITNYCVNFDCLKPLCPDCVENHTRLHQQQQIQSWKHVTNRAALQTKSIYEANKQWKGVKTSEAVQTQNLKRLTGLREKYHRLVDEIFQNHQNAIKQQIRTHYRVDQPDTSKLKTAIEEMEKVIIKLGHVNTVLPALKKCLLLDHRSLIDYFGHIRAAQPRLITESFFFQNPNAFKQVRSAMERSIGIQNYEREKQIKEEMKGTTGEVKGVIGGLPPMARRYSNHMSVGQASDPFEPLKLTMGNYFQQTCKDRWLHFFVPCSLEMKLLRVDQAQKGGWRSVLFNAKNEIPCYFKSIITPNGQIYLTGGSEEQRRCNQIYRYSYEKNYLQKVGTMIDQRSSHSICYLNRKLYIIGGFAGSEGDVTRECQVFDLQALKSTRIAPLTTPSANSCATPFKGQYIFKFGGILNKVEANSLIQMYSLKSNRWIAVGIETPANSPTLQLLSFSAAVQINDSEILVFGGYDNSDFQKPERTCYALSIRVEKCLVIVKNYNHTPLPFAEGFWNNNPIMHNGCVIGLQNVTDQQDELTALADERRVVIFNGDAWL